MSAPPPPQQGPTPQQMQQMQAAMAAEAAKRGMTPQQFQAQQRAQLETEAKAAGMSMEQYINKLKAEAFANHQRQVQAQQAQQQAAAAQGGQSAEASGQQVQGQAQGQRPQQHAQHVPIQNTGTPNPQAVALAKWLRTQDLKTRTCILNGQRKDMFKGTSHPLLRKPSRRQSCHRLLTSQPIFSLTRISSLATRASTDTSQSNARSVLLSLLRIPKPRPNRNPASLP